MPKANHVDFKAVKAAVSMLQILDRYGITDRFKRSGDSLSGCCPLHHGENPTQFRVSLSKNCWNCFGQCKRGGNVLDFVALKEEVSLRDAGIRISEWFGLSLDAPTKDDPREATTETPKAASPKAPIKPKPAPDESGTNKPLGFQLQKLDATHPYLSERGLTAQTIAEFGLGYCSAGSMTGRIVIPIRNTQGEIVAYVGRWPGAPPGATPKYKLPAGFKKSLELFNFHRAIKESSDDPLIIVEGFFDVIKLAQHGILRVVALMGSTLSPAQEELIRSHTHLGSKVFLILDEDEAGRAGRSDALNRLAKFVFVKVHTFDQEGQQPEDLSEEELQRLIADVM